MITPNKFFRTDYGEGLRRALSSGGAVQRIVDFGVSQVFKATTYTCLVFLRRGGAKQFEFAEVPADKLRLEEAQFQSMNSDRLSEKPWIFADDATAGLLAKLAKNSVRLLDLPADMSRGSSTGDDNVFVIEDGAAAVEPAVLRVPLFATDFGRYTFQPSIKWKVLFPYQAGPEGFRLMNEGELRQKFPKAHRYLAERQASLKKRKQFAEWFGYSAARNLQLHDRAQIAVPLLADRGLFAMIPEELRGRLCPMASGGFTIGLGPTAKVRPEFVLGLLNSKLLFWRLRKSSNVFRGGWITCTKQYFGELPIRAIDTSSREDMALHDQIVKLVDQMTGLHPQLSAARTPQEKTALERQIAATDAQVDRLVYELYGLTAEEIKIVEGTAEPPGDFD